MCHLLIFKTIFCYLSPGAFPGRSKVWGKGKAWTRMQSTWVRPGMFSNSHLNWEKSLSCLHLNSLICKRTRWAQTLYSTNVLFADAHFCSCYFLKATASVGLLSAVMKKFGFWLCSNDCTFLQLKLFDSAKLYSLYCSLQNFFYLFILKNPRETQTLAPFADHVLWLHLFAISRDPTCWPWVNQNYLLIVSHNPNCWPLRQQTP